jgi:CheY-like chemotaxis protein
MSRSPGHRVLVVEDNALEREDVCALFESLGESARAVATVEQALAALEEEEFCLVVCDQALPLREGMGDFVTGGERIVRTARAMDRRRTEDGADVTPILAFTSYSEKSSFVTGLFEAGITTFVPKPLASNMTYFLEKYRGVLARAGRSDHGKCAALARRGIAPDGARIAIDGRTTTQGRTAIEINGTERDMQDSKFAIVLRAIVAREQTKDGWSSADALGIGANRAATTHVREPFKGLVPAGFNVLQGDRHGSFRLNPLVFVVNVDWGALEKHPDPAVHRIVVERRKRVEGAGMTVRAGLHSQA